MAFDTTFLGLPTCQPAILQLLFGLFFVIVDLLARRPNRAGVKAFQTVLFAVFLHILCLGDLNIVGQAFVILPFVAFTAFVSLTLQAMLNPADAAAEDAPISAPLDVPAVPEIGGSDVMVGDAGAPMEEVAKDVIRLFGIRTI